MCYSVGMDNPNLSLQAFRAFQAADAKFRNGDGITNDELDILITRYRAASEAMRNVYHPEYKLIENDLYSKLQTLEGFKHSRQRGRA